MHPRIETTPADYAAWLEAFRHLAMAQDLAWVIASDADAHRAAFDAGLSPDEELQSLADMGQWRGCGCGGG